MIWLYACAAEPESASGTTHTFEGRAWTPTSELDAGLVALDGPRLARRSSIDLRGILPTEAELDEAEASPTAVDSLQQAWLEDPHFEEELVGRLGERWLTEVDEYLIQYLEFPAMEGDTRNEYAWERSVGQEPLRLMARIIATDRDYSLVVTSDYTMADEYIGQTWPVDYPSDGTGWQEVRYTDGRPAAGVLATNGLWWRYYTTFTNYNRGRAAALARLLLCVDYLARPVSFSVVASLDDADVIAEALKTNPYCAGCHSSLDPLASSLFGFWVPQEYSAVEMAAYHPEREPLGSDLMGVESAWFGTPVRGLAELGATVAADPRFSRCAAQSAAELYWGRAATVDDFDRIEALRAGFETQGRSFRSMIGAVVAGPVYRAGGITDAASVDQEAGENTTRLLNLRQYAGILHDLTGFEWTYAGFDQLDNDTYGYRVLGGSVDGDYVTTPLRTPSLSWAEVFRRVAEAASVEVVDRDFTTSGERTLFGDVDLDTPSADPRWRAEAERLRWRLLARRPTSAEVDEDAELFDLVAAADDAPAAWAALLASWLRDPDFVSY